MTKIVFVCQESKVLNTNEQIMDILLLHSIDIYYDRWQMHMFWTLFDLCFLPCHIEAESQIKDGIAYTCGKFKR